MLGIAIVTLKMYYSTLKNRAHLGGSIEALFLWNNSLNWLENGYKIATGGALKPLNLVCRYQKFNQLQIVICHIEVVKLIKLWYTAKINIYFHK